MLLRRALLAGALGLAALSAGARAARAETYEERADRKASRGDLALSGGWRVPVGANPSADPLTRYGYSPISAYLETSLAVTHRVLRLGKDYERAAGIDLGARTSWIFGAAGSSGADGRLLVLHGLELMGVARVMLRGKPHELIGAGLELAGGVQVPWLVLRGASVSRPGPVLAPALVIFAGPRRFGYGFRLGYVVAGMSDAIEGTRLPTGGVTFSVSGNLLLGSPRVAGE